jgi:hypothetical protein
MNPLDTMTQAFWRSFSSVDTWEELSDHHKDLARKHMRAALIGLVDADLSEELMDRALEESDDDGTDRHKYERGHFRTMISIIAHS